MDWAVALRGIGIGLAVAAPVGPMSLLCMRRTIAGGALAGIATGAGVALADASYALVAAFGLTAVATALTGWQPVLRLAGGVFLLVLALQAWRARPDGNAARPDRGAGWLGALAAAFALTLANPATILSFAAIFAGLGLGGELPRGAAPVLVGGVFLGSMLWWLALSGTVAAVRHRLSPAATRLVNRGAAVLLAGFALAAVAPLVG